MASVVELESKFLECHICLETYRRPKTIPCLHSFCEQCLNDYISNCRELQGHRFPCPVCKQLVDCPDPSLPRSQWASSFKGSFFLNDLADCLKRAATPPLTAAPCSVCQRRNAATFCLDCDHKLCEHCSSVHARIPTSSAHEVVDLSHCHSPQVHRRRKRFCRTHRDRTLDLYCPPCATSLCRMCHLTEHKLCTGVTSLAQAAEEKRAWLKELEGRTDHYICKLSRINEALNRNLEAANMARVSDAERLKEFFIKAMHALRKKQEQLMAELDRIYQDHCKALEEGKRDREELLTALYNARDLTRSLVEVGSDLEVMQEADSDLGQQVRGLIARVDTLPRLQTPLASVSLEGEAAKGVGRNLDQLSLNVTLSSSSSSSSSPITPTTPTSDSSSPSPTSPYPSPTSPFYSPTSSSGTNPFPFPVSPPAPSSSSSSNSHPSQQRRRTPKLLKRIKTRTGLDREKPAIRDMAVLPEGQLILVDSANACLKGMNMGPSSSTVCRLALPPSPLRVCKLSDKEVAVTARDKKLYVIAVSDRLEATRWVETRHEYWGLASVGEGTLAVSCPELCCIHLIDLQAKVLHTISHDASATPLFQEPGYLSVTASDPEGGGCGGGEGGAGGGGGGGGGPGDILVSDCAKKCIYRLGINGEIKFKYPCDGPFGLQNPRGVCCDRQGSVLCVDREGHKVVRLSGTGGRFAGTLLTTVHGLSFPEAVAVGDNGVVYVTSDNTSATASAGRNAGTQDVLLFEIL